MHESRGHRYLHYLGFSPYSRAIQQSRAMQQSRAVRCGAVQSSAVQCSAVQCIPALPGTMSGGPPVPLPPTHTPSALIGFCSTCGDTVREALASVSPYRPNPRNGGVVEKGVSCTTSDT